MIYDFIHYPTRAGRYVRFCIAADVWAAAVAADRRNGIRSNIVRGTRRGECVDVTLRIAGARELADTLGGIGGDAAVAARMLTDRLEGIVLELRTARLLAGGSRTAARVA